jgi:hypothetical protein
VRLERLEIREKANFPEVDRQATKRLGRNFRRDVVDHQAADRGVRQAGERDAHQATERAADPVETVRTDARRENRQVEVVLENVVVARILEPVAATATGEVGTDHATAGGQDARERIEVMAVAREPVHAEDDLRRGRVAPVAVGDVVEPMPADAADGGLARFRLAVFHRALVRIESRRSCIVRSRFASSAPKRARANGLRVKRIEER